MSEAHAEVYLAAGLLNDFVKSISAAVKTQSGLNTTPWYGYLVGNKLRATCERPIGTALTTSAAFVLELIGGPPLIVRYGAVHAGQSNPDEWTVERLDATHSWLTSLDSLLSRAAPTIIRDVQLVLATAGGTSSRE